MREARRKFQIEGGDQCQRGGGLKILGMGGTGLHEGGQPLDGVGSPPYMTTLEPNKPIESFN